MNESCHLWMSHVIYEWGTAHINAALSLKSCTHFNESWHTLQWVMAHTWQSHGTHMNKSGHSCEGVISVMCNIQMSHGTGMIESGHRYEGVFWVMCHVWMSHGTHMDELGHRYEGVFWITCNAIHVYTAHITPYRAHIACNAIHVFFNQAYSLRPYPLSTNKLTWKKRRWMPCKSE